MSTKDRCPYWGGFSPLWTVSYFRKSKWCGWGYPAWFLHSSKDVVVESTTQ
ncbi:hypothetical protein CPUG_00189 [Cyanophage Syn10]|nr:hypothetical protein CPUG_00189 [Cyanophage Syn10]